MLTLLIINYLVFGWLLFIWVDTHQMKQDFTTGDILPCLFVGAIWPILILALIIEISQRRGHFVLIKRKD